MAPNLWQSGLVTIYRGDCREIMPDLAEASVDAVITDPVWPDASVLLQGRDDPDGLFREAAAHFPRLCKRAVIQLGCDSDPRFLAGMPVSLPFLRACWLEYARPSYKGRLLYSGDVAYVFGEWPESRAGARVLPGRMMQTASEPMKREHPCARRIQHVQWLVRWYAQGLVLDPFCGSGTTLIAAMRAGLPVIGIEIEETFFEMAKEQVKREQNQRVLWPSVAVPMGNDPDSG